MSSPPPRPWTGSCAGARRSTCGTPPTPSFVAAGSPERPNRQQAWVRTHGKSPDDPLLHGCAAAYISDMTFLDSVLPAD
ncbi:hypothetical protein ACWDSD_23430 [Streptomyces spiralis]